MTTTLQDLAAQFPGYVRDLSSQYGAAATMVFATFVVDGVIHRARRFWRSDTGVARIELYTICPINTTSAHDIDYLASSYSEDWLRYVDEIAPTRVDVAAMDAIAAVPHSGYHATGVGYSASKRGMMLEMH